MSTVFSIWTVVVAVLFLGIVIWVWSGRNKSKYDAAAQIPFTEDTDVNNGNGEKHSDG